MSGDSLMQILALNHDLISYELQKMGCEPARAAAFTRDELRLCLKITLIPKDLAPALESALRASGIAVLTLPDKSGKAGETSIILAGSEAEVSLFARKLSSDQAGLAPVGKLISDRLTAINKSRHKKLAVGNRVFELGKRTYLMGILNVTPDSFSDGGQFNHLEEAIEHAMQMAEEGADIIDIGGESTRPGHHQVSAEEELERVLPIINALKREQSFKLPLSIDTYKAEVAEAALDAGVEMLNDVWGLKADPALGAIASRYRVPVCLMHNRNNTDYLDLMTEVLAELQESVALALEAGIDDEKVIIDPGIGFGKNLDQNLEVMLHLKDFSNLGYPILLGTSRKSMIGKTLELPVEERLEGTAATVAYGISAGADLIRVHDVKEMKRVIDMTDAMIRR
jgi:dihydropteroate synthase